MSIGIVGAGTMGTGIAQVAATAGHEVLLYDSQSSAVISARDNLERILNRLAEKQKISDKEAKAIFGRVYFLESISGMQKAGLIIEAIVENLEVKRQIFKTLEDIADPKAILATNTSSLSITSIAGGCRNPNRIVGVHFFNPAPLMKLVEVIPALQSDSNTWQNAKQLIELWGKTTVVADDTPGFIVNRIARPFYSEALKIYEERVLHDIPDGPPGFQMIDEAMTRIGFPMGPFALMDFIGNDVNYAVTKSVWEACHYEPRYAPSVIQRRHVEAGWFGKKSGRGFYNYHVEPEALQSSEHSELLHHIGERILIMLVHEAADAVLKGVASAHDIDLAMRTGVNYPIELLREADRRGANAIVETMDRLYYEYHDARYRCTPILRKYAREQKLFYP